MNRRHKTILQSNKWAYIAIQYPTERPVLAVSRSRLADILSGW